MYLWTCVAVFLAFGLHGTLGVCPSNMGCFPTPGNIAFGRTIGANSTCGDPAKTFEIPQSGTNLVDICDASDPDKAHPASLANDNNETTRWQAEELEDFVTLELNFTFPMRLERSTLTFRSYRPTRMILEKSSDNGVTWTPYQFYDGSCNPTIITDGLFQGITEGTRGNFPSDSIDAFCLDDDSTPGTPIEFGEVKFLAVERFGNNRFDDETIVNHLVVTNLRARFRGLYTLGDTDPFYGVTEWNVEGHCYCNGHAETCVQRDGESDPLGKILSGCDCQNNTEGDNCEKCKPLHNNKPYQIGNSTHANECELCVCNGHATSCVYDPAKGHGVCDCMNNTMGDMCEECLTNFFRDPTNQTTNCVDSFGPVLYGCDSTGVCPCVSEFLSDCQDCNGCYKDVQLALHTQRQRFSSLVGQVSRFADSLPSDTFAKRLAALEVRLEKLQNDTSTANMLANDLDQRLDKVEEKLNEIKMKLDEIDTLLTMANSTATSAYQMAQQIESYVNDTESKLKDAYNLLKTSAEPHVDAARQTVIEMTTLAEEAEALAVTAEAEASDQETKAEELNSTATIAYQVAMEAQMKAQKAVASQNTNQQTLQRLMMAVTNRSLGFSAAKADVMNAKSQVQMAVNKSANVHTKATVPRPDFGFTELQQQLSAAQQKTTDLQNRLSDVNAKFSSVIDDINNSHSEINQLSDNIDVAASKAGYLKTRADEAYMKAKEAVANGTSIIAEAEEMLSILTNFSLLITDTRTKAMEALELIGLIVERNNNATIAAQAILDAHKQAHSDAMMAVQLAEEALGVAMEALHRSTEIRNQLLDLNMTANQLNADAEDAKMNATKLNTTANELLDMCVDYRVEVDSVIADAMDAIGNQTQCRSKIQMSAVDTENLRNDIANIARLDPQQIQSLQQKIINLKNDVTDADLMGVIDDLRQQRDDDKAEIDHCCDLIRELELEVYNLKRAVAAGPDGCIGVGPAN